MTSVDVKESYAELLSPKAQEENPRPPLTHYHSDFTVFSPNASKAKIEYFPLFDINSEDEEDDFDSGDFRDRSDFGKKDKDSLSLLDPFYDLTRARLEKLFSHFDTDEDGVVSYSAFRDGLRAFGIECMDDAHFAEFIRQIDRDNSGGISLDEFEYAVKTIKLANLFEETTVDQIKKTTSITDSHVNDSSISVIDYSSDKIKVTRPVRDIKKFFYSEIPKWATVRWTHMEGIDILNLKRLAIKYRFHPLSLEDALELTRERPKFEVYDHHQFLVVTMISMHNKAQIEPFCNMYRQLLFKRIRKKSSKISKKGQKKDAHKFNMDKASDIQQKLDLLEIIMGEPQQLSLYILPNAVISVQELKENELWENLFNRFERSYSKIRQHDSSFLVYSILDVLVDELTAIVSAFGCKVLLLETMLHLKQHEYDISRVHNVRKRLRTLQKFVKPIGEVVWQLTDVSSNRSLFNEDSIIYIQDVHDHIRQIVDDIEDHLEVCRSVMEDFYTIRTNHQNDIMFILSLIAAFFIPAQFLTGLYGMNFEVMPELKMQYGYLYWWMLVLFLGFSTYLYFRYYRRWL